MRIVGLATVCPALLAIILVALGGPAQAAGPWKAQVVDAETGAPLEGVVVLAHWTRSWASVGGWAGGDLVGVEETVTGPDGRFGIGWRWTVSLLPLIYKITTEFTIVKPGYGHWDFRDPANPGLAVTGDARQRLWRQFEGSGVLIHLPRLRTRAERLQFFGHLGLPPLVPPERAPRLTAAEQAERAFLGLDLR